MRQRVVHVLVYAREPLRVLLLRRPESRMPGWQSVTGRVESADADLAAACLREIAEETGLPAPRELRDLGLERSYEGYDGGTYDQCSFAAEYDVPLPPRISDEHEDARWVTPDDAIAMARWESDRDAIRALWPPEKR